jgi:tyrosyl-tRNA synthetase
MEKLGMEPQVCLTLPLLEGTDGVQKMSKSYGNYIGLTDVADEMFGKVMSIPDELMVKYYRLCTSLSVEELDAIEAALDGGELHPNAAKRRLGREIVTLYHDAGAAMDAEAAFDAVFKRHEIPEDVPEVRVERQGDRAHLPVVMKHAGLAPTTSEARRLIAAGAVKIDGDPVALEAGVFDIPWAALEGRVLQAGKRRYARIVC